MALTRPVKILYLMDSYAGPTAGTERQLLELITHIDRKQFEPSLAVFRPTDYLDKHSFPCAVKMLNIHRLLSLTSFVQLAKLSWVVRRGDFKIVHILFNDASTVAPLFCKLAGAKTIASRRDMGFWYTRRNLAALKVSNRFIDCIVSNCQAVNENVIRWEGFRKEKMVVIYNGHDKRKFSVSPAPCLRESLGIGINDPIIGMVANLSPIKRHADLIRAFSIAQKVYRNIHLVLVGDGMNKIELQNLSRALSLEGQIHFLGSLQEAVPIIKHFTLGVLCSESEGLSNAIIEYMGCGIPTICTNVGGNPEIVEDGSNGFLVNVGDVQGLANQLIKLLADHSLTCRMGENSILRLQSNFSIDKMVKSYMHLYAEILSGTVEPISKLLEEHGNAGELHKAVEVGGAILPANE